MQKKIINNLKILRTITGLSQYRVANRLGWSQSKYSSIERGDVNPTPDEQEKISNALRISRVELFSRTTKLSLLEVDSILKKAAYDKR